MDGVAVLARVEGELRAGQLAGVPADVERVLEDVVVPAQLVEPRDQIHGWCSFPPSACTARAWRVAGGRTRTTYGGRRTSRRRAVPHGAARRCVIPAAEPAHRKEHLCQTTPKGRRVPRAAPTRAPPADRQRLGRGLRTPVRVAGLRGAGHHQQRVRGHARAAGLRRQPRGGPGHSASLAAATDLPCPPTSRTASPMTRGASPRRSGWPARRGLAGCSIEDWSPSGQRIYELEEAVERVAAAAAAAHEGDGGLVLTAQGRELPARAHGSRRHDRAPAPLRAGRGGRPVRARAWTARPTSRPSSRGCSARSTCWRGRRCRPLRSSRRSASSASRWAAPSPSRPSPPPVRPHASCSTEGTYGYSARAADGGRLAREAFGAPR